MSVGDRWGGPLAGLAAVRDAGVMHDGMRAPSIVATGGLFRVLIEHTSDIVTVVAPDGRITYQSPSCRRVLGHEPQDLVGTSSFDLIHPEDLSWAVALFNECITADGVTPAVRIRCRHRNGSWVWLEAVGSNLVKQPEVAGMIVSSRDITAQVRAEQALQKIDRARQEEAEVMAAIAHVGQELISCLDTPALVERLCRVTTEVLRCDFCETRLWDPGQDAFVLVSEVGVSSEEHEAIRPVCIPRAMVPLEAKDVWHGRVDDLECGALAALARRFRVTGLLVIPLRRGAELVGIQTAAFRNREARFTEAQVQIARALGQLATMALENARLVEELQQASRLKSEFVATMSHELRTPLNVIIGYTDLLIEESFGSLSPEQRQVCRRVERSAEELLELINATLDLGRLESGRLPLDLQEVPLNEMLAVLEAETRELGAKPGVSLVWRIGADLPRLRTDPLKVKVILKNLLANAMKFTPAGEVEVAVRPRGTGIELSVRDTGIGMAPETQAIIFEPFRQADGSMSRRFGGIGLGLYIVRRLVDVLNGTVTVDSELGHGSTFRVYLPDNEGS